MSLGGKKKSRFSPFDFMWVIKIIRLLACILNLSLRSLQFFVYSTCLW